MKRSLMAVALAAAPLAACAGGYYYDGPGGPGPIAYDGFYDDYYGPIYGGYWGGGDVFYYRNHPNGRFIADRGGHFRHDMPGANPGAGVPQGGGFDHHGGGFGHGGGGFHAMHGTFSAPHGGGDHGHR